MYSLKYKVTTSTCDSEGRLKLYSALQMMQDCSEMWIDSEPGVKKYFTEQNMAQLLATRQVEIIRVPEYKEELTVTTSVYGMKPMFGFRSYTGFFVHFYVSKKGGTTRMVEKVPSLNIEEEAGTFELFDYY